MIGKGYCFSFTCPPKLVPNFSLNYFRCERTFTRSQCHVRNWNKKFRANWKYWLPVVICARSSQRNHSRQGFTEKPNFSWELYFIIWQIFLAYLTLRECTTAEFEITYCMGIAYHTILCLRIIYFHYIRF